MKFTDATPEFENPILAACQKERKNGNSFYKTEKFWFQAGTGAGKVE
jgi:hypothetical protein